MNLQEHARLVQNLFKILKAGEDTLLIQTHISTIILSGDLAYKLKKPVDFGFLDYSTLEKRHKYCLEEVRINKGFAPELYLGVVRITGSIENPRIDGEGTVLDYAVKMRRFSQGDQLDNMAEQGRFGVESADRLAELIASYHKKSAVVDPATDYGEPERVFAPMRENFDLLRTVAAGREFEDEFLSVVSWSYAQFDKLKPLLQKRKKEAFVRECHGDLHLHNIAFYRGGLILFDAIEFNPYLNHIDVISDLSFLLMDLEYRGLHSHSRLLLNRYLEITGDYEGVRVLDFYKSYRAMVRAKVAVLRATQVMSGDEYESAMDEAAGYIALAFGYSVKKMPFMAVTHGYSGSGKSTFALMAVESCGAVRIRSDVERMRMFEHGGSHTLLKGIYTPDATRSTYRRLLELAVQVCRGGYPVIADATFLKR
jgi:aminoglycoside phosphotransferase family enzyme